jgi:3-oxoacyl-[acyl-carrier protein] reductase
LGRAIAAGLLAEGATVTLSARVGERLERTRSELGAQHAIAADLGKPDEAGRAVREAASAMGGLDVLVTNTGGPPAGRFEDFDLNAWRTAVDLLLFSTVEMVRAALPWLRKSSQARIVMIGSNAAVKPIDGLILSNTVRAGVVGLARTLVTELAPDKILVNVVHPGMIATDRIVKLGMTGERVPLGRIGQPDEFAALCVFLASARASYVDGTAISVDGGLLVR